MQSLQSINHTRPHLTAMPATRSQAKKLQELANEELLKQANPRIPFNPGIFMSHVTEIGWSKHDIIAWVLGPSLKHLKAWKAAVIDDDDQYPHLQAALGSPEEWNDLIGILTLCTQEENIAQHEKTLITRQLTARAAVDIARDSCSNSEWKGAYIANKTHCQAIALLLLMTVIFDMHAKPMESWFLSTLGGRALTDVALKRKATAVVISPIVPTPAPSGPGLGTSGAASSIYAIDGANSNDDRELGFEGEGVEEEARIRQNHRGEAVTPATCDDGTFQSTLCMR